jgi:hypothetical protein
MSLQPFEPLTEGALSFFQLRYDLACSALSALPLYLRLLRKSFLWSGVGQPLLKLLEAAFQVEDPAFGDLPVLAFRAWDILGDIFQVRSRDLRVSCLSIPI